MVEQWDRRTMMLLQLIKVPVPRRYLEAVSIHRWQFEPKLVRDGLDRLRATGKLIFFNRLWPESSESGSNLPRDGTYGLGRELSDKERQRLQALVLSRDKLLTAKRLGRAGERWVRAHLKRSNRYRAVTPESKLGFVTDLFGENRLDIAVTDKLDGIRYACSVKNRKDFLDSARIEWIDEVESMAKAHGMSPWLIPAFATSEMLDRCQRRGVRCTPINSRIAPEGNEGHSTRSAIDRMHVVIGPEPWRYIGERRLKVFDEAFLAAIDEQPTGT